MSRWPLVSALAITAVSTAQAFSSLPLPYSPALRGFGGYLPAQRASGMSPPAMSSLLLVEHLNLNVECTEKVELASTLPSTHL